MARAEGIYKISIHSDSVNVLCMHLYQHSLACQDDIIETPDGMLLKDHVKSKTSGRPEYDTSLKPLSPKGDVRVTICRKPWLQKPIIAGEISWELPDQELLWIWGGSTQYPPYVCLLLGILGLRRKRSNVNGIHHLVHWYPAGHVDCSMVYSLVQLIGSETCS